MNLRAALEPILSLDLVNWTGLPTATLDQFDTLFGPPVERIESTLGYYPATRYRYQTEHGAYELVVWVREGTAVMIETLKTPDVSILVALPKPSAVLANEILIPDAYAHEYLYCTNGLVLTVAQPYSESGTNRIVRCRGIKPLASVEEFGPAYYQAFDDQVQWANVISGDCRA